MIYNFTCDYYANKKYETKSYLPMLDVIFIDADKENYIHYYNLAMSGLLSGNGFILADNSMCALLYDETDERSKKLHEFNQFVKNDKRVEQVILTIREGISMIKPIKN